MRLPNRYRAQGYNARLRGIRRDQNPYKLTNEPDKAKAWDAAWSEVDPYQAKLADETRARGA